MTHWLIEETVGRSLAEARAAGISPAQQEALSPQLQARGGLTSRQGTTAEIVVEGPLTKHRDFFAWIFYGSNTTYTELQAELEAARIAPAVERVRLLIDSPGGQVNGLFETLDAVKRLRAEKPIESRVSMATSAAYALAAAAGPIEATSEGAMVGSIGAAVSYVVHGAVKDFTNSDSPDKRPDPRTAEGKAAITRGLDEIFSLFAEHIAGGRGTTVDHVRANYGRGAVLLAREGLKRGMVDAIVGADEDGLRGTLATGEARLAWLKQSRPDLVDALRATGIAAERERCSVLLEGARLSGEGESKGRDLAVAAIRSGAPVTDAMRETLFLAALEQQRESDRQLAIQRARTSVRYADVARKVLGAKQSAGTADAFADIVAHRFCSLTGVSDSNDDQPRGAELRREDGRIRVWLP